METIWYKANSVINCLANMILFWQGLVFYFEFIKREQTSKVKHNLTRFGIALLLIGSMHRTILDFGYVFFEVNKVKINALPALMRNLGNGILLMFLVNDYKNKNKNKNG